MSDSNVLRRLAEEAARLRRKDKDEGKKVLEMKEYFIRVLKGTGIPEEEIPRWWFVQMGQILGKRGERKTAQLIKSGVIKPKRGKKSKKPRRFRETFPF